MVDLFKSLEFDDPLLPTSKAAQLLGISTQTLATWRHRGDKWLPWVKLGKRAVRYKLTDVQQFIAENRHAE
jgi:predicted DNA-binding transcriptional regulator AlpA